MMQVTVLAGAAVTMSLLLAACTGGESVPTSAPAPAPTTAPVSAPPTSAPVMQSPTAMAATAKPGSMASAPAASDEYRIVSFKFPSVSLKPGGVVTWVNGDPTSHSVTSGAPGKSDGKFASSDLKQGEKFTFTFADAGQYTYFCKFHPDSMTGTVNVAAASVPIYEY